MARLHLLRRGAGDHRLASTWEVDPARVHAVYGDARVHSSDGLPVIDGGQASAFMDPEFAVIELVEGEPAFPRFRSPGFNWLRDVDPREAYHKLTGRPQ